MNEFIKTMIKASALIFVFCFVFQGDSIQAQVLGTDAVIVNENGIQCSSVGIGYGIDESEAKVNASKNRIKAEKKARKKSNSSFSNKKGGGSAVCIKYKPENSSNIEPLENFQFSRHEKRNSDVTLNSIIIHDLMKKSEVILENASIKTQIPWHPPKVS